MTEALQEKLEEILNLLLHREIIDSQLSEFFDIEYESDIFPTGVKFSLVNSTLEDKIKIVKNDTPIEDRICSNCVTRGHWSESCPESNHKDDEKMVLNIAKMI